MSFEVQTYRNGNWDITKVLEDKNSAIAEAQKMLEGKIHFSVKVVEEVHDEATDQYRSKVVFRKEKKVKSKEEKKKAKPAGAAEQQRREEEAAEEGDEDEDEDEEEEEAAAVPKKKIGFEKIFIRGLLGILLLAGGAASYWQSQQPDPEPEIEGPPKTSLEAEMLKNLLSESDGEESDSEAREAAVQELSGAPRSTSFGEWSSVPEAAQKGFTEKRKSSGAGLSGASRGEGSGEGGGGESGGGEGGGGEISGEGGEEGPGDITFGSGPAEEWSSVSGAAQKGFTKKRKSAGGGQYRASGEGGGEISGEGGVEGPGDITFGSGPAGEWSSVPGSAQKGFTKKRKGSGSGAGSDAGAGSGVGDGSQEEELAALAPLGPPIFFPLPVFEYLDVRNKRLERAVVLQVTLDVVGDEGLDRVKEKADDLHTVLNKELSRIVSKAEKDKDSFTVSFLKKRFLVVCARELGKGVVREVLIQDSREARSSR
ncbi:MAG: hypothetical protein ISR48_03260 [Alphaproteobacteria bacterium]|nr:hypothetical protein [Alphaproteobacteria bacterium]